jgi:hypothetical protein
MSYGTSAYADARLDELHRAGAARRRAAEQRPAREERLGLVMAFMRKRESAGRAAGRRQVAAVPSAPQH